EYDYVVGIDFGTTYSCCCFALVEDDSQSIEIIRNWPRQSALITTVPTTITYSKRTGQPIGIGNVPETPLSVLQKELPHSLNTNFPTGRKDPKDYVADFLKIFNDHILKKIKQSANNPNLKPRIRYCFTLQHPGEPNYKKNFIASIVRAGLYNENDRDDKLVFLDSYTAMAKYFLKTREGLNLRDKFIVCDADDYYLTIKTIEVISNGRNKDVKELKLNLTDNELGGNQLDIYFKEYISVIARQHDDYKDMEKANFDAVVESMVQNFVKNIKYKDFGKKQEIYIAKPASPFKKSKDPYLTLNTDDLKKNVYDKVIDQICKHVLKVCHEQEPKAFFLFGKFSNSDYLYERLKTVVDEIIVIPEKDVSAAQGSVFHGLNEPLSIQRMMPIHEGINQLAGKEDLSYYDFNYSSYTHVIGIDFGTSFSKWYYQSSTPSTPVEFDKPLMQIPSFSLYDQRLHEQKLWGTEAYKNYYSPENSGKLLARFKLLLNEITNENFDELIAVKYIASYLKALHTKILETMKTLIGDGPSKFRYCLTVPTIWSDRTKKYMRDAAVMAEIIHDYDHPCRLMLVNEPEAAAMFYTKSPDFVKRFQDKTQMRALVCDAGGGTVDMATYDLFKVSEGYAIDEVTPGSGGICGASFLDDRFRKLVARKCYDMDYRVSDYALEQMVNQFATKIKDRFMASDKNDIEIDIPDEKAKEKGLKLEVTPNELSAQVFEPVTDDVLKLIKDQHKISARIKENVNVLDVIILTGGLGQSRYLQKKVRDMYPKIPVYSPEQYDQSVVRGAVALALNPNAITQRIIRKSYGVEVMLPFNSVTDPAMNKFKTIKGKEYTKFKYDNFACMHSSVRTYDYLEKQYYVEYPNNTYAAIYASDYQKDHELYNVRDPRAEEIFKFNIEMPKDSKRNDGDVVPLTIRMFLGQTEIKIDTIFEGETTRQSFIFHASNSEHREETEKLHRKVNPLPSVPKLMEKKPQ
ncbi:hypothetical protein INT48_007289, partial [Thamnidium elegans]